MQATGGMPSGGLPAAVQELDTILKSDQAGAPQILLAAEKCCAELRTCFETPPSSATVPLQAAIDALGVLASAISAVASRPPTPEAKLAALTAPFWSQSLFPIIDSCCFSERWAAAVQAPAPPSTPSLLQNAARDLLKDGFIPLLADALPTQGPDLPLAPHLGFLLQAGTTAADFLGWRGASVSAAPGLRNYGLANVLWVGIQRCWAAVGPAARPALGPAGLAAAEVARRLGTFLDADVAMLSAKKSAADVKLLQFWIVNMAKVVAADSEAAPTAWTALWSWAPAARAQLAAAAAEPGSEATALAAAVDAASLWVRAARAQAAALGRMAPAAAAAAVAAAAEELGALATARPSHNSKGAPVWAVLASAVELLGQAGAVPPPARPALGPLFRQVLSTITASSCVSMVDTAEKCVYLAEAALTCALALSSAVGGAGGAAAAAAWEDCQLCLLELSARPHPAMLAVLSVLWTSLAVTADATAAKGYASAMAETLTTAAAVEAAGEVYAFASPAVMQLTHLLAALLGSLPAPTTDGFAAKFLRLSPAALADRCSLASLAANLRAVAHSQTPSAAASALHLTRQLTAALAQGSSAIGRSGKAATSGTSHDMQLYLAWAVDALGAALECLKALAAAGLDALPPGVSPQEVEDAVGGAASQCIALITRSDSASSPFLAPALHTLRLAWQLHPAAAAPAATEAILPCLERALQVPAAASGIAALTPALKDRPNPPKALFAALLGPAPSPALHVLGRDAYVKYAQECSEENVLGAVPAAWIDPGSGGLAAAVQPTMERYLQRQATGGADPPSEALAELLEREAAAWPDRLAKEAAVVAAAGAAAAPLAQQQQAPMADVESGCDMEAVKAAAEQVVQASERLRAAWGPAAAGDGAVAASVRRTQAILAEILT